MPQQRTSLLADSYLTSYTTAAAIFFGAKARIADELLVSMGMFKALRAHQRYENYMASHAFKQKDI